MEQLEKMTVVELKALAFDLIVQQQQTQNDLNIVNQVLQEKLKEQK